MTEQYTPTAEEVRELIAEAEEFDRHPCDPQENYLIHRLADALETMYDLYLKEGHGG